MEKLILYANKLQDVCTATGHGKIELNFPQIVVVGPQSTGKTSVLESFVGKDFLPRGRDIVTRRPLVLQLIQIPEEEREPDTGASEWAVFDHHNPPRIYTNFEDVKEAVDADNKRVAGKGVSSESIGLKIFSPKVVPLTLVDLPGLVMVAVGTQPNDIGKQVKEMAKPYLSKASTIILAIIPATDDLATSHAMKIAKTYDPDGQRTLAVVTKLDLVEKSNTELMAKALRGEVLQVKLGIVGVVNRSQSDIFANKSIESKKLEERKFLRENYPSIAHKHGTDYLAQRLSELLSHHIQKWIPDIQKNIDEGVAKQNAIVDSYAMPPGESESKISTLFNAIQEFTLGVKGLVDGGITGRHHTKKIVGGARISDIFFEYFPEKLNNVGVPRYSEQEIKIAVNNAMGVTPHLFIPQKAFKNLVLPSIEEIQAPSLDLAEKVRDELKAIIEASRHRMLGNFQVYPALVTKIMEETETYVKDRFEETKTEIKQHVLYEQNYLNLNHPDFQVYMNESRRMTAQYQPSDTALSSAVQNKKQEQPSMNPAAGINSNAKTPLPVQSEKQDQASIDPDSDSGQGAAADDQATTGSPTESADSFSSAESSLPPVEFKCAGLPRANDASEIYGALKAYMKIVKKTASDMIPKIIMTEFVIKATDKLESHLHEKLNHTDLLPDLIKESSEISAKRENAELMLSEYDKANLILNEIKCACGNMTNEEWYVAKEEH